MPTLTITKLYSDGNILTEAMLDAMKDSIETFFNVTKIDASNIQTGSLTSTVLSVAVQQSLVPVGTILDFGGTAPPAGFVACDGSSLARAGTYANLFSAIGTAWGSVDGSHFNVPNLARTVTVGSGGSATGTLGNTVGSTGGEETHTLLEAELAAHSHGGTTGSTGLTTSDTDPNPVSGGVIIPDSPSNISSGLVNAVQSVHANMPINSLTGVDPVSLCETTAGTGGNHNHGISPASHTHSIATDGSGTPHNNIQPSAVVLKIIKY